MRRGFEAKLIAVGVGLFLRASCLAGDSPMLRFEWMAVFQTGAREAPATVTLISRRIHERLPHVGFQYTACDERNRILKRGFVGLGLERDVSLADCPTELCLLQAEVPHGSIVRSDTPHCFVASADYPLRLTDRFDVTLYFYVPRDCEWFGVGGECGPNRVLPMAIHDPEGGPAAAATGRNTRTWFQTWRVDVPGEFRGRVWKLRTHMHGDLRLKLEGNLPPLLALEPDWAETIWRRVAAFDDGSGRNVRETDE